jgi:FG-GAP-like repeat/PASTA domain
MKGVLAPAEVQAERGLVEEADDAERRVERPEDKTQADQHRSAHCEGCEGVFLSRSGGNVWSRRDHRVPAPAALAIGDLNGDDKPELVVATARIPGTVSVLNNTGEGRFRERRDYGRGDYPLAVAIADVNDDGKLDVATANFASSTGSVFRNRTGEPVQICTVPSVRGATLAAAKKEIAQAHCRVGRISSEPYRAPAGRVVVESPPAGTRMRSGGRVDLLVNRKLRP